jgi:outer membrane biosynthesis protein TonB
MTMKRLCVSAWRFSALLPFCLPAVFAVGCTHASAKTSPDMPGLEMPPPPPRDVEPADVEVPPPVPLATEPAHNAPPRTRPTPPPRPAEPRTEAPKPEPPTPVIEPPKPAEEAPRPPTTLQTTPATAEGEVERGIRASLQRATADLNRVDYRHLNTDARTQYDQAKRFVGQADDAIRMKNLLYAKNLAEKAATIAAQLAGR